jgi:hypothetical protein
MLANEMNVWVRIVGPLVACLLLLAVGVRAAGSISGERARNTWDELMTTPLSSDQILFAKWFGSILSVRWGWLWLLGIWWLAVATGGMSIVAFPPLMFTWLVYAALIAVIGLSCSMICRNTLIATLLTLVVILVVSVGHWLVTALLIYLPFTILRIGPPSEGFRQLGEWFLSLQMGLTPPIVLGVLPFRLRELNPNDWWAREAFYKFLTGAFVGVGVSALAAGVGYVLMAERFRKLTNRIPLLRRQPPEMLKKATRSVVRQA